MPGPFLSADRERQRIERTLVRQPTSAKRTRLSKRCASRPMMDRRTTTGTGLGYSSLQRYRGAASWCGVVFFSGVTPLWHRAGFRAYWRWKSRPRSGRPKTPPEIRQLIREISLANPLWGAPRLHGELLKLGIDVGQTTVAKYMARGRRPPSQGWKTFLHNHADGIASIDLFVVPTISFRLLYGLLILHHDRRQILWLGVTAHPTAEWISRQLTEAYGWKVAPRYIIRDRDAVYGDVFIRRLRAMGIRDRPTAARSPW